MKIEQKIVIKIVDMEIPEGDVYDEDGLDFGIDNDEISPMEHGFLVGFMSS